MKVVVTEKLIRDGQSFRGGWSERQFEILGFSFPAAPGWRRLALGREISSEQAKEFLSLKVKRLEGIS